MELVPQIGLEAFSNVTDSSHRQLQQQKLTMHLVKQFALLC